jgi:hypothetical protein
MLPTGGCVMYIGDECETVCSPSAVATFAILAALLAFLAAALSRRTSFRTLLARLQGGLRLARSGQGWKRPDESKNGFRQIKTFQVSPRDGNNIERWGNRATPMNLCLSLCTY